MYSIAEPHVSRSPTPKAHSFPPAALAFLWSRTGKLQEAWNVVLALSDWPGAAIIPDRSGLCLTLDGVRLGHLRWNGRIDLPFGPLASAQLIAEGLALRDPDEPETNRVVFDIRTAADVNRALWLFRLAYLIVGAKACVPERDASHRVRFLPDGLVYQDGKWSRQWCSAE